MARGPAAGRGPGVVTRRRSGQKPSTQADNPDSVPSTFPQESLTKKPRKVNPNPKQTNPKQPNPKKPGPKLKQPATPTVRQSQRATGTVSASGSQTTQQSQSQTRYQRTPDAHSISSSQASQGPHRTTAAPNINLQVYSRPLPNQKGRKSSASTSAQSTSPTSTSVSSTPVQSTSPTSTSVSRSPDPSLPQGGPTPRSIYSLPPKQLKLVQTAGQIIEYKTLFENPFPTIPESNAMVYEAAQEAFVQLGLPPDPGMLSAVVRGHIRSFHQRARSHLYSKAKDTILAYYGLHTTTPTEIAIMVKYLLENDRFHCHPKHYEVCTPRYELSSRY